MQEIPMNNILQLRPVDRKRLDRLQERTENPLTHDSIGYVHTILTQCFLPYKDPKATHWKRKNGKYSIILTAGFLDDPAEGGDIIPLGLPFGAKPRLFQSYICTKAIKHQSRVIPVERSMTAMIHELGFGVTGGKHGTIYGFKEQINRFARCRFDIVIQDDKAGKQTYIKAEPIERFEVWFAQDSEQHSFWPSEIVLTDQFYQSLKEHAVPHDFRSLAAIQNKPRAIDIYLWMTQRQCRIPHHKPLLMRWKDLHEMFGGQSTRKEFKRKFPADLMAARTCYPDAKIEEHPEGYLFKRSPTPIPKTQILIPR
jgi:Plasmid encoded RepA protein